MTYQSLIGELRNRILSKEVASMLNVSPRRLTTNLDKFIERISELDYSYFTFILPEPYKAINDQQAETIQYLKDKGVRLFKLTFGDKEDVSAIMLVNDNGSRISMLVDGNEEQRFEDVISYNDTFIHNTNDPKDWLATLQSIYLEGLLYVDTGSAIIKHGACDEWIDSQLDSEMFKDILGEDKEVFAHILRESISVVRTAYEEHNLLDNIHNPVYYFDDIIDMMSKCLTDYSFYQLEPDVRAELYAACLKCYANDGEEASVVFDEVDEMIKEGHDVREVIAWPYIRAEL